MLANVIKSRPQRVPWRMFRHDAANPSPIPAWGFVLTYVGALWLAHFCQTAFGAVAIWPANGVVVTALLLLNRRKALMTFLACVSLNFIFNLVILKTGFDSSLIYPALNALEVFGVAMIARRFCGGGLHLNRPVRMARYALLAAAPTVCLAALIGLTVTGTESTVFWPYFASWVTAELLPILILAPCVVMLTQRVQPSDGLQASSFEAALLISAAALFTASVCMQVLPLPIVAILPVMMLVSLRLTSRQAAVLVLLVSVLTMTIFLHVYKSFDVFTLGGPPLKLSGLTELTTDVPAFYMFLAATVLVIFSVSTVVNEKTRLHLRVLRRAAEARSDAIALKEAKVLAEQASEAKRRFLNMISHELRTPLGQVAGFTGLVARDDGLSSQSRDLVGKISMANGHAMMLVDDMIDFARGDICLAPAPLNLREVVSGVVDHIRTNVVRKPLDVLFENRLDQDTFFVGDEKCIRQLLRLLMHNAVKFTDHGKIGIEVEATAHGARLVVFDTGPGFSPGDVTQLQEAFAQGDSSLARSRDGTGLGLALAARIMAVLDGQWEFDSRPGEGTRITIDLPMERAEAPADTNETPNRAPRILIVDDHPANREILGLILRAMGCETDYASDGLEAVDAARHSNPDIIFMDLRMPRMDGYEASRQIRALPGDISQVPILAVSAECREESAGQCTASGIDGFLAKPVNQALLYETVVKWMDPVSARAAKVATRVA